MLSTKRKGSYHGFRTTKICRNNGILEIFWMLASLSTWLFFTHTLHIILGGTHFPLCIAHGGNCYAATLPDTFKACLLTNRTPPVALYLIPFIYNYIVKQRIVSLQLYFFFLFLSETGWSSFSDLALAFLLETYMSLKMTDWPIHLVLWGITINPAVVDISYFPCWDNKTR